MPGRVSHRGNVTPASSGRVDGPAACGARRGPDGVRGVVDFCEPAKIYDSPGLPTGDIPSRKLTAVRTSMLEHIVFHLSPALADSLPWNEFTNIPAEAAVEKMFMALNTGDMTRLKVILSNSSIPNILETYRGSSLIRTGTSFKSGTYDGVFVPCKVRMADGKTRKMTIALKKDARFNSWVMDGGM